jgi:hypothetical protein
MKFLKTRRSFKKEFRRQLRLALIAAIGFTVAFAWRNAIYNSAQTFITIFTEQTQVVLNELLTALIITFLAVVAIFITSRILREK